jgi:hypothetical protein
MLDAEALAALPAWLDVPLFALLGLPVYVCAAGATPLVAVLIASGVSPGAAIAFLITGPATNLTTIGLLSSLHGRGAALRFAALMASLAVVAGWTINAGWSASSLPAVTAGADDHAEPLAWVALAACALLLLAAWVRQGPRGFLAQLGGGHHGHPATPAVPSGHHCAHAGCRHG